MRAILFENGVFWPGTAGAEIRSLLVRAERIEQIDPDPGAVGDAVRVDLGGRSAIPGPVDAHCHLVSYGMQCTREADLRGASSLAEIGERLRAHAEKLG